MQSSSSAPDTIERPSRLGVFAVIWHALALIALVGGLSVFVYGGPIWRLSNVARLQIVAAVLAYIIAVVTIAVRPRLQRHAFLWLVVLAVCTSGVMVLALVLAGRVPLTSFIMLALAATVALGSVPWLSVRGRAALAVVVAVSAGAFYMRQSVGMTMGPAMTRSLRVSALATLDMKFYRGYVPKPRNDGGAVVPVGNGFLLVDGDGRFSQLAWNDADDALSVTRLTLHAPVNFDEFRKHGAATGEFVEGAFRVADLVAQDVGDRLRLVTSHHYWKRDEGCWVARLSETTIAKTDIAAAGEGNWRTLFESQPCLQLNRVITAGPFLQMGGSMILFDAAHVLLGLGDHAFDGINARPAMPQDPAADYGKTLLIDLESGEKQVFSIGHRNSHGAVMTADGAVWMTEMGPQGGDELNRIQRGMNYGWPNVTFGTQYGGSMWPPSTTPGRHTGFQPPVYAWVPSLAPSGLIQVGPHTVGLWQGDLLVTTLRGRSLQRIRLEGDRVAYVETIETGRRMRDIAEGSNGRIVVWTDLGELISIRKAAASEGERLFGLCASCHEIGNGAQHGAGPDLAGVIGRGVGKAPGFDFSPALTNVGGQWTEERLAAFLRDPQAFAPGTSMPSVVFSNPTEIASLVAYLRNR